LNVNRNSGGDKSLYKKGALRNWMGEPGGPGWYGACANNRCEKLCNEGGPERKKLDYPPIENQSPLHPERGSQLVDVKDLVAFGGHAHKSPKTGLRGGLG